MNRGGAERQLSTFNGLDGKQSPELVVQRIDEGNGETYESISTEIYWIKNIQ